MPISPSTERCAARKANGASCRHPAGYGTGHAGYGRCKWHGVASPNSWKGVGREMTEEWQREHSVSTTPEEFLTAALDTIAGEIAFCNYRMALGQKRDPEGFDDSDEWWRWHRIRESAITRGVVVAQAALAHGIAERQTLAVEEHASLVAGTVETIFDALGLTPDQEQRLPAILEAHASPLGE